MKLKIDSKAYYTNYQVTHLLFKMPCSYCRNSTHNISQCDSPSIRIHYERLKTEYEHAMRFSVNEEQTKRRFINYHLRSGRNYLKAVAIRYAGALASWNNAELLEAIWIHFTETGSVPNPSSFISNSIPATPTISQNNIHMNEYVQLMNNRIQDLTSEDRPLSPIIIENFTILDWFVDRTPSPDSHINVDSPIYYNSNHYNRNSSEISHRNSLVTVVRNLMNDYQDSDFTNNIITKERRLQMFNIIPMLDITNKGCNDCSLEECTICFEEKQNVDKVTLNCGHKFCGECIDKTINTYTSYGKPICALCRTQISTLNIKNPEIYKILVNNTNANSNINQVQTAIV